MMELILMLLVPLPLGFFVKNKVAGFLAYIAVHGFAFTFQTLYLVLGWIGGDNTAFGSYPNSDGSSTLSYGAVNAGIFLVGLALVTLGQYLADRRRERAGLEPSATAQSAKASISRSTSL